MDRPGLTDAYLERLLMLARAAGIDAGRLANEVADHLAEAAAEHRSRGLGPLEAERRAIEEFGEVDAMVIAVASTTRGGTMPKLVFSVSAAVAVAATAVLVIAQTVPSQDVAGTPFGPMASAAGAAMLAAGLTLAWSSRRTAMVGRPAPWVAAWLASTAALGALAASSDARIGSFHVATGSRAYLALIAFLALLVAASASGIRSRTAVGIGLVAAGLIALVLNGALGSTWKPLGAIGEGQANMAVELMVIGWLLVAAAWVSGPRAARVRSALGGALIWAGRRVAPAPEAGHEPSL